MCTSVVGLQSLLSRTPSRQHRPLTQPLAAPAPPLRLPGPQLCVLSRGQDLTSCYGQRPLYRCASSRVASLCICRATSQPQPESGHQDANQLVTQLNSALAQEDYARASELRDKLKALQGTSNSLADWRESGCPDWLADRAEKLGFRFPTGNDCMLLSMVARALFNHNYLHQLAQAEVILMRI